MVKVIIKHLTLIVKMHVYAHFPKPFMHKIFIHYETLLSILVHSHYIIYERLENARLSLMHIPCCSKI